MTFPEKETMIPFGLAQQAIKAVADCYTRAIDEVIVDPELKNKLVAEIASNVFVTMLSVVKEEHEGMDDMRNGDKLLLLNSLMGDHD